MPVGGVEVAVVVEVLLDVHHVVRVGPRADGSGVRARSPPKIGSKGFPRSWKGDDPRRGFGWPFLRYFMFCDLRPAS
jgi:hypothetical protein